MNILMCEYLKSNTPFQVGSHYYAKQFIKDNNKVIWLNNPQSSLINSKNDIDVIGNNNNLLKNGLIDFTPKVLLPFCNLPIFNSMFWAKNYLNITIPKVSMLLNKEQIDILWMTNVKMYELYNKLKCNIMIHRMADDFSGFSGTYNNILRLEEEVIKNSDLVIVSANNLYPKAQKLNKNVIYVPNGVDFSRFENIQSDIPKEYENINCPKIIYVGAVDDWFDYELLDKSSRKLNEFAFIIIGSISNKLLATFKEHKNVFLLGKKPHNEIPKYLKYADIGIIPFINNKLTNSIHPLKLYEYCAAGLPVISRKLEEIENMKSPAMLYNNIDEFCDYIKISINGNINKELFIEYARNNTWEKRYCEIQKNINMLNRG